MGEMWDRNGDGDRSELRTLEAIRCTIDLKCVCQWLHGRNQELVSIRTRHVWSIFACYIEF